MSFSNLEYLYNHLPTRYRRADVETDLFLKRFLSVLGEELDGFDKALDEFYQKIDPATAPEEYLDWWLWALFGWGWFPSWFTLAQKRQFYADIAGLYAKRGTRWGIELFLAAFGIKARVITRPLYWREWTWGEDDWTMTGPLIIIVQVFPGTSALPADQTFWGEFLWGESFFAGPGDTLERADIEGLLRFQWPAAHHIIIENKTVV